MKTQQLRTLLQELSNLNNSFTHYFFVWTQFEQDYQKVVVERNNQLTSEIFEGNGFSRKHNIQLSKLNDEHGKTNKTLLNGIFTLIYSAFENYLADVYSLAKELDSTLPELNEGKYDEDDVLILKIINRLKIDRDQFEPMYLLTLDYIRLKRNRLIHQSSLKISRSLREVIKKSGQDINSFWNNILPKKLQGIDFASNENANEISYNVLIDSLNILRGIAIYFDNVTIKTFQQIEFLKKEVLVEFKNMHGYKNFSLADERNKKKFLGFCKAVYGFMPSDYDFQEMI